MSKIKVTLIGFLSCCLTIGCGSKTTEEPEQAKSVIPTHQLKALKDAQEVEQKLIDIDEERKKALSK